MTKRSMDLEGPHPVDRHVGHRLRIRRIELGLSQTTVAEAVNLTFQQIQKYERGSNRISASKLLELSKILAVNIEFFFHGLSEDDEASQLRPPRMAMDLELYLASAEGKLLANALMAMPPDLRSKVAKLADAIADPDQAPE